MRRDAAGEGFDDAPTDHGHGERTVTTHPPHDEDLVDTGGPDRPVRTGWRRRAVVGGVLVVVAVLVSIGVAQRNDDRRPSTAPTARVLSSTPAATPAELQVDGSSGCGTLVDGVLSVAFAVLNTGGTDLVLDDVRPVLPLGGLVPIGGTADRPPSAAGCPDAVLRAGDPLPADSGGWIALTFRTATSCLAPLPVLVDIDYTSAGRTVTSNLSPFPDLAAVAAATADCDP